MTELLSHITSVLSPFLGRRHWLIGYSGGLDSHVLLHLIWRMREQAHLANKPFPVLSAIHVDHQLHNCSTDWAVQCAAQCSDYGIPIDIRSVEVGSGRQGLEALARAERYRVFEEVLGEDGALLLAHHQDDQAETFLLRLMRGSGVAGLAAMPVMRGLGRGILYRPLLDVPKAELERYASVYKLKWVDDPSNEDVHYRRNFLRHKVMPVLAEVWPGYRSKIVDAAELQSEAADLLSSYLNDDIDRLRGGDGSLDLLGLADFDRLRQRAILRHYVYLHFGVRLDKAQSDELVDQFLKSSQDSQPVFSLGKYLTLRAFSGRLYCERGTGGEVFDPSAEWDWDGLQDCLVGGVGKLSAESGGDFVPRGKITIRFRQGGERCHLAGHAHSKSLKKVLQELMVPPWQRERLPLIYCGGQIAAIADLAICEGYKVKPGECGIALRWRWNR